MIYWSVEQDQRGVTVVQHSIVSLRHCETLQCVSVLAQPYDVSSEMVFVILRFLCINVKECRIFKCDVAVVKGIQSYQLQIWHNFCHRQNFKCIFTELRFPLTVNPLVVIYCCLFRR